MEWTKPTRTKAIAGRLVRRVDRNIPNRNTITSGPFSHKSKQARNGHQLAYEKDSKNEAVRNFNKYNPGCITQKSVDLIFLLLIRLA